MEGGNCSPGFNLVRDFKTTLSGKFTKDHTEKVKSLEPQAVAAQPHRQGTCSVYRKSPTQYLGRVCNVVPVGGWKLQFPSQDLVKEIFLEIVLTGDKEMEKK